MRLFNFKSPTRALTLVEVMFASGILTMVVLGVLQGMLQSRRMTEGSVRQASVASLVQGYLEQIKGIKYGDLPLSPATLPAAGTASTDEDTWVEAGYPPLALFNSSQSPTKIYLAVGTPPTAASQISALPTTDLSMHFEQVDIDNISTATDNSTLNMWVWIKDLTGTNVADCKSIVIAYQWTVKDGGRIKTFSDMTRTVRSSVPTD